MLSTSATALTARLKAEEARRLREEGAALLAEAERIRGQCREARLRGLLVGIGQNPDQAE